MMLADDTPNANPNTLLTTREVAVRWRMSGRTLERWRAQGQGPAWLAIGGRILYPLEDIQTYEALRHRPRP